MHMETRAVKPLFKYIGGKTWLKEILRQKISYVLSKKKIEVYVEPFVGGLGSFLSIYDLLIEHNIKKVILSDINVELINLYNNIKIEPKSLYEEIIKLEGLFLKTIKPLNKKTYSKLELSEANDFFKHIRTEFNLNKGKNETIQSARLVFLQKHSFNGVYRENSKGEYNTPFNWSHKTMDSDIEHKIYQLNNIFLSFDIKIEQKSYQLHNFNDNALFYLDPPYLNTAELVENKYNQNGFNLENQLDLIHLIQNTNFIYSNHASQIIENELNKNHDIEIIKINRKNIMSANSESRGDDKIELLATSLI